MTAVVAALALKDLGYSPRGRVMIQNAYDDARQHLEEDKLDYLVEQFITHYAANMPGASTPYPGLLGIRINYGLMAHPGPDLYFPEVFQAVPL